MTAKRRENKVVYQGYLINVDSIIKDIKRRKRGKSRVCLQMPDGLKPVSGRIAEMIKEEADCDVFIWAGSCFGSCDLPLHIERLGFDALIHIGHAPWRTE